MRLISANVNGIRAAGRRGGLDWLLAQRPDVVAMQAVRAGDADLRAVLVGAGMGEWHVAVVFGRWWSSQAGPTDDNYEDEGIANFRTDDAR